MIIRTIVKDVIELTSEKRRNFQDAVPIRLIIMEDSDGQLHITPKRPGNKILFKDFNEKGKKKSIMSGKYDVLVSDSLQIVSVQQTKLKVKN